MGVGAPPRPRIGVVIPALDEEAALPLVLAEIPREWVDVVVVVDNGSRDRTAEVARAGGAVVVCESRRGYGNACLAGLDALLVRGAGGHLPLEAHDVVVFLDADHSDHAEELPLLVQPILDGRTHFVVGARRADPASRAALMPQQRFGNALACGLMRLLFRAEFTDLGPFRAIRVDALRHLGMRDRDYGWTVEMQLKSRALGLAALEVPVHYRARIGTSKISGTVVGSVRAGWKILGWIVGWRISLWRPAARHRRSHAPAPTAPR